MIRTFNVTFASCGKWKRKTWRSQNEGGLRANKSPYELSQGISQKLRNWVLLGLQMEQLNSCVLVLVFSIIWVQALSETKFQLKFNFLNLNLGFLLCYKVVISTYYLDWVTEECIPREVGQVQSFIILDHTLEEGQIHPACVKGGKRNLAWGVLCHHCESLPSNVFCYLRSLVIRKRIKIRNFELLYFFQIHCGI